MEAKLIKKYFVMPIDQLDQEIEGMLKGALVLFGEANDPEGGCLDAGVREVPQDFAHLIDRHALVHQVEGIGVGRFQAQPGTHHAAFGEVLDILAIQELFVGQSSA